MPGAALNGAGFFGKVSSHGDFVSRRLPSSFTGKWDGWLQASMRCSRQTLGAAWVDAYLTAPIWRFALAAGICGPSAWAGVLMPSVDCVGRYFPLTVAMALPGDVALLDLAEAGNDWYARLESLMLSSLDRRFTLDHFDAALRATAMPALGRAQSRQKEAARHGFLRLAIPGLDGLPMAMPELSRLIAEASMDGRSAWWSQGSNWVEPSMVLCCGLPGEAAFTAMLKGFLEQGGAAAK